MIYYFFLIFTCIIFVYLHAIVDHKLLKYFLFIILVIVTSILPGLRDITVGSDTYSYALIFASRLEGLFGGFEPGFNLFIFFLQKLGLSHYSYFFIFFAFITNYLLLYSIFKLTSYRITSVILFISLSSLYLFEFNVVRQSLAIALFSFSLIYLKENQYKKSFLIIILSILFHYSALFLFIVPCIYIFFKNKIFLLNFVPIIIVLVINLIFSDILNLAISLTGRDAVYSSYNNTSDESGLRYIFLINMIIYIFMCWGAFFSRKLVNDNIYKLSLMLFSFLIAFNFCITFLGMRYEGIGRIMNYFFIAYFLGIPPLICLVNVRYRPILAAFIIIMAIFYIFILVNITNINGVFPYKFSSLVL